MSFDATVRSNCCNQHGHRITNFPINSVEKGNQVTFSSEFFCTACGMSLDEMRIVEKVKRPRKPKDAPVEVQQ